MFSEMILHLRSIRAEKVETENLRTPVFYSTTVAVAVPVRYFVWRMLVRRTGSVPKFSIVRVIVSGSNESWTPIAS